MAEYIDRNLIEWYGCDFENDSCKNRECSSCSHAECSHSQVMQIPIADVVEREKINKAIEEITGYARFHRDKTHNDTELGKYLAYEKCIEILKRNMVESII